MSGLWSGLWHDGWEEQMFPFQKLSLPLKMRKTENSGRQSETTLKSTALTSQWFSTFSKLGTWSGVRLGNRAFPWGDRGCVGSPPPPEVVIKVIEQLSFVPARAAPAE